jgi:hypothetical protein
LANGKYPPVLPISAALLLNVEPLSEARTPLTDFFSILLGVTFQIKHFTFSIEPIIEGVTGAGSPLQIEIIGSLGDADL